MSESLFEPFESTRAYGGYYPSGSTEIAYRATMIDRAIRADDVAQVREAIDRGWLTPECRAFDNSKVVAYADYRGAVKIATNLRLLGWPE